jgi:hypothetical protein
MNFNVRWSIDIEADTPQEAAIQALAIQRDPESSAVVFEVHPEDRENWISIDLDQNA